LCFAVAQLLAMKVELLLAIATHLLVAGQVRAQGKLGKSPDTPHSLPCVALNFFTSLNVFKNSIKKIDFSSFLVCNILLV